MAAQADHNDIFTMLGKVKPLPGKQKRCAFCEPKSRFPVVGWWIPLIQVLYLDPSFTVDDLWTRVFEVPESDRSSRICLMLGNASPDSGVSFKLQEILTNCATLNLPRLVADSEFSSKNVRSWFYQGPRNSQNLHRLSWRHQPTVHPSHPSEKEYASCTTESTS